MLLRAAGGGEPITTTVEGRERYTINVRYSRELRDDVKKLKHVLVPVMTAPLGQPGGGQAGGMTGDATSAAGVILQIPLGQLVDIRTTTGPPVIRNENGA